MRVRVQLTEMENAKANYVSLVARGANRIPFRIVKSAGDKEMLNLSNIRNVFKAEKVEPEAPSISAVVVSAEVQKSDKFEAVKAALTDAGFTVEKADTNEDGSVMFSQTENPLEDGTLVRMNENLIMVVKGFCAYSDDLKGFSEIMGAEGYYDGLNTATNALRSAMGHALRDSETPQVATQKAESVLSDFNSYVLAMVKALPEKAFKAESQVEVALSTASKTETVEEVETVESQEQVEKTACPEGMDAAAWEAMSVDEQTAHLAKKTEVETVETVETQDQGSDEEKIVRKTMDAVLSVLKGELAAISGPMAELGTQLAAISESNAALAARVDEVARMSTETAQKADQARNAVSTTVNNVAAQPDAPAAGNPVKKTEHDPRSGCFDTAFLGSTRR